MSNFITKIIPMNQVQEGMVLGKDVITDAGTRLMAQGTFLTQRHILRLRLNNISLVSIRQLPKKNDPPPTPKRTINSGEIQLLKKIQNDYKKVHADAKQYLINIGEGKPINSQELFKVSTSLLNTLRSKSDLFTFLSYLRIKDDFTFTHSINVAMICHIFGHWLKMPSDDIEKLTISALLHDLGKTRIDPAILNKKEPLTEEEFRYIREHTLIGYEMIKYDNLDPKIMDGILYHHERFDGSGYPKGLKKDEIPKFAKIIAIADMYDAMTSDRAYREKMSPFAVISVFEEEGYNKLDTKYLLGFLENIAYQYMGRNVSLSDGRYGKIVFIHNKKPSRPIIQIDSEMVDLSIQKDLQITQIL